MGKTHFHHFKVKTRTKWMNHLQALRRREIRAKIIVRIWDVGEVN